MSKHISALDGLRAFAVIFVLLRHTFKPFDDDWSHLFIIYSYNALTPMLNGWIGVDLFFVLSGFLITQSFKKYEHSTIALKAYCMKRILRIVPTYYVMLVLCSLLVLIEGSMNVTQLAYSFTYHLLFLQDYLPPNINVVFWSLGVEQKFYMLALLFLPFVFWVFKKHSTIGVTVVILSCIIIGIITRYMGYLLADSPNTYDGFFLSARSPFHACLEPLLLGILIAILHANQSNLNVRITIGAARVVFRFSLILLICIIFYTPLMASISMFDALLQPTLISFCMAGLVFGAAFRGACTWLESKFLQKIAILSYSLYLVHLPLWPSAKMIVDNLLVVNEKPLLYSMLFATVYGLISWIGAWLLYTTVEQRFLKIKNKRYAKSAIT